RPSATPFLSSTPPPPTATLFPYTTLFRSHQHVLEVAGLRERRRGLAQQRGGDDRHLGAAVVEKVSIVGGTHQRVHRHRDRAELEDRKSTRLNSSHVSISYAVFCLKKKNT